MPNRFSFNESQFNKLFPFYILIGGDLSVISMGESIRRLIDLQAKKPFNHYFSIPRPFTPFDKFDDLLMLEDQMVVLESVTGKEIKLRGQFEFLPDTGELLFVGTPWFGSMEQVRENGLTINDFARHDPMIDLLHVMKAQEIANEDLKQLINTINNQKNELKKANKEIHEIALFPTQNPDPLIRINTQGELLRNNPAAARLDFFEFENRVFRNDEFFSLIADRIDKTNPRWIIEAISNDRFYSFVCVTMPDEGYINIYGRDITRQKKDQLLLERLSLVASANDHGVLFTTPQGYITWANDGFCKLVGYSLDEVIGRSPIELCRGPLTDESMLSRVVESFFKGEGLSSEIVYYRKDKSWFWGRSVSQPIKDENGKITEFFGIIQDVTDEKASEEKLKVLSQIAEDNINAVIIADKEGKITWVNRSFIEMTGYSLEESIGKIPGHFLQGPDTDKNTIDYLRRQVSNGEPFNAEIINYTRNGVRYWIRVQGQPIKNEKDELVGFFALEEDITKEKDSEHLFRRALENIGDNVWEHDFRTGKTYFSKSENEFLGYATDELTSNRDLWWNSVYEEDRYLLVENDEKYRNGKIDSHNLEYRIINKHGETKWVLDRGVVIEKDKEGRPLKVTGTHTDITERKEFEQTLKANEEKYRGIIANMNLGLMEINGEARITYANQTLLKMTGLSEEDSVGFDSLLFLSQESQSVVRNKIKNRTSGISEAYEVQVDFRGRQGWWLVSSAPKLTANGDSLGSVVICLDITIQKNLEKDLIKSRIQAEQLAKVKENFLANMSHEIRTPMNAIMGMGNQLARTNLTNQQKFYLHTINIAAENLLVIINDILDLSKIEAGKLSVEKIGFEPKKAISNAVQVMMHKVEEKGLKLTNSYYDSRISPILIGDPFRLNQVLLNLISNAIKFTEKGSVDIVCEVAGETENTQMIRIKVIDTGIGMSQEFVEKLFDKFSQEYESGTRRFGGTGLGMSICKELIELMGGHIEVHSSKGRGTTIEFTLEFAKGKEEVLLVSNTGSITSESLRNRTILVVDDNEMNKLVASTILENYHVNIIEASNGEEALEKLDAFQIDLVLMDIQMPVLNGLDATRAVRARGNQVPVIALTANAIKGENDKCIAAGMNDYLAKPFKEDEFISKIAYWLNGDLKVAAEETAHKATDETLYSLDTLKEISRGNDAFIRKMVNLFCDQAPVMIGQMKEAISLDKIEVVGAVAHKLKPSIDNMNITSLKEVIRTIEKTGKGQGNAEELNHLLGTIEDVISKVIVSLRNEFPR